MSTNTTNDKPSVIDYQNPDHVIVLADELAELMKKPSFTQDCRTEIGDADAAAVLNGKPLLEGIEAVQRRYFDEIGRNGDKAVHVLRNAVKSFPNNNQVREAIVSVCSVEEDIYDTIGEELARKHGMPYRSIKASAIPQPSPQQMQMMQMAMQTLTTEQRDLMKHVQEKMMKQQLPTPEEQKKVSEIRSHLMAVIMTMQESLQAAAAAGGAVPAAGAAGAGAATGNNNNSSNSASNKKSE